MIINDTCGYLNLFSPFPAFLSFSEFKSVQFPIIISLSKQLLNHSFYLLPKCDSTHSLPLLRLILSLCVPGGTDGSLCVDDVILLKNIICDRHDYLKKLIISKGN